MENNQEVIKIHDTEIQCPMHQGEKFVAVKPICQVLGISHQGQFERLKNDGILNSVVKTVLTTGADSKQYKMIALPVKYVFGWLFSIDSNQVKADSRENLITYQKECYDILYETFFNRAKHYEKRDAIISDCEQVILDARSDKRDADARIKAAKEKIEKVKKTPINQLDLFDEEDNE